MGNIEFVQQSRQGIEEAGFSEADINGPDGLDQQQKNLLGLGEDVHVESITVNSWDDMKKVVNRIAEHGSGDYDVRFGAKLAKDSDMKADILSSLKEFGKTGNLQKLRDLVVSKVGEDGIDDLGKMKKLKVAVAKLENKAFDDFDLNHEEVLTRINRARNADGKHVLVVNQENEGKAVKAIVDALQSMQRMGASTDGVGDHFVLVVRKGDSPRPQQSSYEGIRFTPEQLQERLLGSGDERKEALEVLAGIAARREREDALEVEQEISALEQEAATAAAQRKQALEGELSERRQEIESQLDQSDRERELRLEELAELKNQRLALAGASFRGFLARDFADADLDDGYVAEEIEIDDSINGITLKVSA